MRVVWRRVPDEAPRRDVAWGLLREALPHARLTNACPVCGGPHGPVRVLGADAAVSVAYADGFAVVVIAPGAPAVGVDAEREARAIDLERVLGPTAAARDWVRVEAVLKADGRGLRAEPALVDIRSAPDGMTARVRDRDAEYEVRDVDGPPGLVVSVAVRIR